MTAGHRYPWAHTTQARRALDLTFDVQTTDPGLGRYLDHVLGALPVADPGAATTRLRFGFAEVPGGDQGSRILVRRSHRTIRAAQHPGMAFQDLFAAINRATVRASMRRVLLHAGLVGFGDHGVMLVGVSGSGKSSLTSMLCAQGARYGTDEVTAIEPATGALEGASRPIVLKRSAPKALVSRLGPVPEGIGRYLDRLRPVAPADLGAEPMRMSPRTVSIAFVRYAPDAPPASVVSIPRADAVAALVSACWNRAGQGRAAFDAALSLVRDAQVARVEFSDCGCAAEEIRDHLGRG